MPKIEGPPDCGEVRPRWYYDLRRGQCQAFYYNGCNGNANNFEQYDECMSRCESVEIPGETRPDQQRPEDRYDPRREHEGDRREEPRHEVDRPPHEEYEERRPEPDDRRNEIDDRPSSREHVSRERGEPTDLPGDREDFLTPTPRHEVAPTIEEDDHQGI